MTANDGRDWLIAVTVDSLLYVVDEDSSPDTPRSLQGGGTPLGVKFGLRWLSLCRSLGRHSFVAVLPLVDGPAHADTGETDGDQDHGGDEPLFHDVLHYNHRQQLQC